MVVQFKDLEKVECPDCQGEGYLNQSDCCGSTFHGESDDDGICGSCKEHCSNAKCEKCNGTGEYELWPDDVEKT